MRKFQYYCILILLIIISPLPHVSLAEESEDTINIGGIFALTGPATYWGDYAYKGFQLAIDEANEAGGVNGKKIRVILQDSQTSPAKAVSAYQWLKHSQGVDIIAGDVWTFLTNSFLPMATRDGVSVFSALQMSLESPPKHFINAGTRGELTVKATRDFFKLHPKVRKVAIFGWDDDWGRGYLKVWKQVCQEFGVKIVYQHLNANDYTEDYRTAVTKAISKKPEALIISYFADRIVKRFAEQKKSFPVLATSSITEIWLRKLMSPEEVKKPYYVDWLPEKSFLERFKKRYGVYPLFSSPEFYEVGRVLVRGLKENPKDPVSAVRKIKYQGISGPMDFIKSHNGNYGEASLMQIQDNYPAKVVIPKEELK